MMMMMMMMMKMTTTMMIMLMCALACRTRDASLVVSADSKIVKMWHRSTGDNFCNIETIAPSEDLAICPNSGMIFLAGRQVCVFVFSPFAGCCCCCCDAYYARVGKGRVLIYGSNRCCW